MPFPVFKDLNKTASDVIEDDFDSKFTFKIKSAGPFGTTITTNTQLVDKDTVLALKPKVTFKWPHPSGFTLEKLEFSPDCKMTLETSLVGAVPDLKVEFKGNDAEKADLSLKYTIPAVTLTGDFDINNLSTATISACGGTGLIKGGASAVVSSAKGDISTKLAVGATYTVPKVCFSALSIKENFSKYSMLFAYHAQTDMTVAGSLDYSAKKTMGTLAGSYCLDPMTTLKAKANTDGIMAASVKRNFEKKFSVVGSLEMPSNMSALKWGLNATLG